MAHDLLLGETKRDFSRGSLPAGDGRPHNVDVLIHSKAGARAWGGDDAVQQYLEDPEASVSDRIEIKADVKGRVY